MFFPKLRPSELMGQSMKIAAAFLTVALVPVGQVVYSGPLYREGNRLFVLQTRKIENEDAAVMEVVEIPEGAVVMEVRSLTEQNEIMVKAYGVAQERLTATTAELEKALNRYTVAKTMIDEFAARINGLEFELQAKAAAIANAESQLSYQQTLLDANGASFEEMKKRAEMAEHVGEQLREENANLKKRAELTLETAAKDRDNSLFLTVETERELRNARERIEYLEGVVSRYNDLVGPLTAADMTQGVNAEVAEQLKLIETEATAPGLIAGPPPVIEGVRVMGMNDFLSEVESGGDPLGTGWIETVVTPKTETTIRREGSHTDEHFRRLMFLTGGDV